MKSTQFEPITCFLTAVVFDSSLFTRFQLSLLLLRLNISGLYRVPEEPLVLQRQSNHQNVLANIVDSEMQYPLKW